MNRWLVLTGIVVCCAMMLAQIGTAQYEAQPAVPAPSTTNVYGAYPGYAGGTTAAGSAMNGMANAISAKGNYNLSTSAAAINMTQAQSNEMQNHHAV